MDTDLYEQSVSDVKGSIKIYMHGIIKELNEAIGELDKEETFEGIMRSKRKIMYIMLELPIKSQHCVFCRMYHTVKDKCRKCPYGKKYGECNKDDSVYNKLCLHLATLKDDIFDYWKGL